MVPNKVEVAEPRMVGFGEPPPKTTKLGTRVPPSYSERFRPRNGPAEPLALLYTATSSGPLSVLKRTSVAAVYRFAREREEFEFRFALGSVLVKRTSHQRVEGVLIWIWDGVVRGLLGVSKKKRGEKKGGGGFRLLSR